MGKDLTKLRHEIDSIDTQIVKLLSRRFKITKEVGLLKKEAGLSPIDKEREATQFARIEELAIRVGLDPEFAKTFLNLVITETVKNHIRIKGK